MPKYRDWLKAEQTNINPAGTPVIVRPNETVGAGYAALTMMNDKIRNTPETARGGYSAFATPTEQARVNAAQQKEKAVPASKPSSYLGIEQPPALSEIADPRLIPTALPKGYSYAEYAPSPYDGTPQAPVARATAPSLPSAAPGAVPQYQKYARSGYTAKQGYESVAPFADPTAKAALATVPASATTPAIGSTFSFANLDDASKAKLKQNNPAFYNQLLVQGIISPMAEDEKPANVSTATAPKTDAESTSTGETGATGTDETEPTGYAKYLAMHPEYAEADRRAEAEYARALPTYGALAERMAQAGIHGGYSDYLQGVAYAKMQDAKQQNEEAARAGYAALTGNGGTVMGDTAKELYKNLLSEYGDQIAGITDETQYAQFEDLFRSANKGLYSDADIESALKQAREYRKTQKTIDTATVTQGIADYTTGEGGDNDLLRSLGYDPETFIEPQGEKESDEAYAERYGKAFIAAVNDAYKGNRIDKPQHSAILTTAMPIFDEDFDTMDWKDKGASIAASIDLAINGDLTDEDYAKVVEKVKEHLKSVGVESIYYDHQGIGRSSNLNIKIRGGAKNYEDIHADQVGGNITQAEKNKLAEYNDLPLAYLVNSDGTTTLYYQNEHGWRQLKTKGGSTSGSPKLGNNWYKAIAFLMMNGNKPTETVTTSKNQTYKFITN